MARRISGDKAPVQLDGIAQTVSGVLDAEQDTLLAEATARRVARTADVGSLDEARAAAETGWARLPWDTVGTDGEADLATSGITVRCLTRADGSLPATEPEPELVAYVVGAGREVSARAARIVRRSEPWPCGPGGTAQERL